MDSLTQQFSPQLPLLGDSGLQVGGCAVADLAATFGTPLYVYDAATMNAAAATYSNALQKSYPG